MKTSKIFSPIVAILLMTPTIHGVVIQFPGEIRVEGVINGGLIAPDETGDTLDYLKFEVLSTSDVTVEAIEFPSNRRLMLAEYIGTDEEFGFIGNPYLIRGTFGEQSFTRELDSGIYVIAVGTANKTSYDVYDGFTAINPEGGGFSIALYTYTITGDVQALEFWDGNLDGTFTITTIPEPSTVALLLAGAAVLGLCHRRRRPAIPAREP